ncbi:MAG: Flavodoxin [Syntrophus sp. PtaB.Bin001]|nr:MAG: Flavodoxin [Syntrophus sp. PtaB.Bin001]
MQVLVTYFSRTGHTKMLAEAIAQGVSEVDQVKCLLKPISEVTKEDFTNSDGVIVGSPVYFGGMAAEVKALLDSFVGVRPKMADKIGAAFATSGDLSGGKETTLISLIQTLLIYGMIVVGDPMDATGHYGVSCVGEPDTATRVNGNKLGKRVATLVKKLRG